MWVPGVLLSDFNEVDKAGTDYSALATDLLELLFKKELCAPDDYCCTISKGKTLLNQDLLRGIRCKFMYTISLGRQKCIIIMAILCLNFSAALHYDVL